MRVPTGGRTLGAAGAVAVLVTALLVGWFAAARGEVRAQQRELLAAPVRATDSTRTALAVALRGELERVLVREAARPYFHYQNLFHDPKAGGNLAVAPSPLAALPDEPLVLGYFQIDGAGQTTTPTLNDEVPALSEQSQLASHRQFRDEVARSLAGTLAVKPPLVVAQVEPSQAQNAPNAPNLPQAQQIVLDPSVYAQNTAPTEVYRQQNQIQSTRPEPAPASKRSQPAGAKEPTPPVAPLTITITPLEWQTLPFCGTPTLVAVRHVETPDGTLAQGFVLDRSALTTWLAAHAGTAVARLVPGPSGATSVAPGWQLDVTANPRALTTATTQAVQLGRAFLHRFTIVSLLAILGGLFVVWLVARAEQLARERSQFAAAAAHELRTPLAGLQLYGDMIADELGDPAKQRDYARRMSEEASRLGRVVSNVLGFSQLERGNLGVEVRDGDLGAAIHEVLASALPTLERAGVTLMVDVPESMDARFDRDALARILANLLDNAEKYSRGSPTREVSIALRSESKLPGIEIAITDPGPGIPAASRARLFRPFARAVSADGPAGLGLGLALSRSLARAMQGELTLSSSSPTTFTLRLPG